MEVKGPAGLQCILIVFHQAFMFYYHWNPAVVIWKLQKCRKTGKQRVSLDDRDRKPYPVFGQGREKGLVQSHLMAVCPHLSNGATDLFGISIDDPFQIPSFDFDTFFQ
jgi:hypothetical protein